MASAIPLALSLLQTVASQYPGFQKAQPTPPTTVNVAPTMSPPHQPTASNPIATPSQPANISAVNTGNTGPQTLCEQCHLRPKYFDGIRMHSYCSKSCAKLYSSAQNQNYGSPPATGMSTNTCNFCHARPKYNDGTRLHPFCGKACAKASLKPNSSGQQGTVLCKAPACQKAVYVDSNGTNAEYCSISHKNLVESICLMCHQAPKLTTSHFCSKACTDEAEKKGPMILEVPAGHVTFKSVAEQFKTSWRHHGTTCPPVRRIYKILSPQSDLASYNAHKAAVESREHFMATGRAEGNENRRWHGTRRQCHLGDGGKTQFCNSITCSLCCIVKTSFDVGLWGKKTGWGRFGKGIYTSSTSSKANDYSHNDSKCTLKAILLNKVVVGKGCKMTQDNVNLTTPPPGYDSVLAEKGGSLNYDELVVYSNDAIRPSFLVMYEP